MAIKEWMISNPKLSIIILAFLVTLFMTLVTKKFTNQARMKELKGKQKELQKKMTEHRKKGEMDKMMELQKEVFEGSMELMRHSFKPLFITLIPLLIFFWWIRDVYAATEIAKSWIWYYILTGLISSIILRKVLDVA